jgi:hypothetical protein
MRKVVARLWLSDRRIVLHRTRPLFLHHKLLTARRLRPIMACDRRPLWPTPL